MIGKFLLHFQLKEEKVIWILIFQVKSKQIIGRKVNRLRIINTCSSIFIYSSERETISFSNRYQTFDYQIKITSFISSQGIRKKGSSERQFLELMHLFTSFNFFEDWSQLVIVTNGILCNQREQRNNRLFSLLKRTYLRFNQSSNRTFPE